MPGPLAEPLGFGGPDWIELLAAVLLAGSLLLWRPYILPLARRIGRHPAWCAALLATLALVLRLALLPNHPIPTPGVYDEFGHLLVADTLLHVRLANPIHPMHRFFETIFVLQQPTYSSIYPLGMGMLLAAGRLLTGLAWSGVLLAMAAFCALCYWMLRGWVSPGWALAGAALALARFGPLNDWTNCYWGGHLPALAGCLVFGALPRLTAHPRARDAVLLGLGLGIHLLTRPFETIFLLAAVLFFFVPQAKNPLLRRPLALAAAATLPAIGLTLLQNRSVTGSWTTLPYLESRAQYGVPTTFSFEPVPVPSRALTVSQAGIYRMQSAAHGPEDSPARFLSRLAYRVRFLRFFLSPPLYLALLAFPLLLNEHRWRAVLFTCVLFFLGGNLYPFFFPHYAGALAGLFLLAAVAALSRIHRLGPAGAFASHALLLLALLPFAFWYPVHLLESNPRLRALEAFDTWDGINHPGDNPRAAVAEIVAHLPGRPLIFVQYPPTHSFQNEWVWNAADVDSARAVWALDLGPADDEALRRYYPNRTAWLFSPDTDPTHIPPYRTPQPTAPPPPPSPAHGLTLEQVH